jgi:hypothetical protein
MNNLAVNTAVKELILIDQTDKIENLTTCLTTELTAYPTTYLKR